jgi:rubrerythrin
VWNCLQLEKTPTDYNEEDLQVIKDYNEKVALRVSERAQYRKMLQTEFHELLQMLKVRKCFYFTSTVCSECNYCIIKVNI